LPLLAVVAAAFLLRAAYALLYCGDLPGGPRFDGTWYERVARDLLAGEGVRGVGGQPTAFFPPGYPALLAAAYAVFGASATVARLLNCAFGALTALCVFHIGRLAYNRRVGLLGAALFAVFPGDVFYAGLTLSEPAFTCAFSACLLLFLVWNRDPAPTRWRWLVFGLLLGGAAMIRGIAVPFLIVPAIVWARTLGLRRETLARTLAAGLGLALALLPWTLRNQLVMGYPLLLASDGANALIIAHSPLADGSQSQEIWAYRWETYAELIDFDRVRNPQAEVEVARQDLRHAARYFLTHPRRELLLVPLRLYHLLRNDHHALRHATVRERDPETGELRSRIRRGQETARLAAFADAWFFGVLTLAALGATRAFSPAARAGLLVPATPLFFLAIHAIVFWGDPRFHAPFVPMLALLAALAVDGRRRPWALQSHDVDASAAP
jgi:4-amino-4-deoxy-L-arabinose transferase-like glycosyltransferase